MVIVYRFTTSCNDRIAKLSTQNFNLVLMLILMLYRSVAWRRIFQKRRRRSWSGSTSKQSWANDRMTITRTKTTCICNNKDNVQKDIVYRHTMIPHSILLDNFNFVYKFTKRIGSHSNRLLRLVLLFDIFVSFPRPHVQYLLFILLADAIEHSVVKLLRLGHSLTFCRQIVFDTHAIEPMQSIGNQVSVVAPRTCD